MREQSKVTDTTPIAEERIGINVWLLGAVSFLTDVGSEMILTILPIFLVGTLGVGTATIGLIEGISESTASVGRLFSGWFSDKIGNRKWLTTAGYGLSTVAKALLFLAATWPGFLALKFFDRVGKSLRVAPRDALLAASAPASRRGLAFGFHRAADTSGAVLGLVGGAIIVYLYQAAQPELLRSTFQVLVLVGTVPAFLAVLVLTLAVKERKAEQRPATLPTFSLKGFDVRFKLFLVVIVLFNLGNSSDAFLVLRANNVGLPLIQVFAVLILYNVVYATIAAPAGALSDRIGRRNLIVVAWLWYGLVYLGFALTGGGWQIWSLFACYGLYIAINEGVGRALVADLTTPEQRGMAFGMYNAVSGMTLLVASLVAGVLWQGLGPWHGFGASAPFLFGAVMAILAGLLMLTLLPRGKMTVAVEG